jgi:serine/threonine-protein kinase
MAHDVRWAMPASPDDGVPSSRDSSQQPRHGDGELEKPVSAQRPVTGVQPPEAHALETQPSTGQAKGDKPLGERLETVRYEELETIARGSSGVVVRAWDKELLREVAIKILDPELAINVSQVEHFKEEARINGQLEHPSIVPVHELGIDQRGRHFLVMKLVERETLEDTLARLGEARLEPVHLAELLQVMVKVCDAVSFAHSRQVLHRDLKPKNIMLGDFGQVYVLDWGVAQVRPRPPQESGPQISVRPGSTEPSEPDPPGSVVGTACYMPPEQLQGRNDALDARTDVFALGSTLYQILTGRPPLTAEIVRTIWLNKQPATILAPEKLVTVGTVPSELARIAMQALEYDPRDRYASVADFKRDIETFQRGAWDLPRVRIPAGTVIVKEGEPGDAAFVIVEGQCVAYRADGTEEIELRTMGPGEVFGETAVFSQKPRSASVKALSDVVLRTVTGEVLSKALGLNSWMGAFVRALAHRFREADQRLHTLTRTSGVYEPFSTRSPYPTPEESMAAVAEPGFDLDAVRRAAQSLPRETWPAGATILQEGASAEAAYVILEGRCADFRIRDGQEILSRSMGRGDLFGEVAILSGRPQPRSVKAVTDVVLAVVSQQALVSTLGLNSWMGSFVRSLAMRFLEMDEQL